ncbi:Ca(2+)-dependent cysteine protease [Tulasnella sp. 418]|nr:Ca(2+)-dependent cysteine protease [Tulasnella sp. 418]
MELNPSPTLITPLFPHDPVLDPPEREDLQFILESPQKIVDSLQVLARSVLIFGLSALYLVEQATFRACAFDVWVTTVERELEPKREHNYESVVAKEEASSQFLSFHLQKAERLETLCGHLDLVKKMLRLCADRELQDLVVNDAIAIAYIVAWIIITDAEELKNVLANNEQEDKTAAFVRAVWDDTLECRQMSKYNQKKLELGHFTYYEICRQLLDDLSLHVGMPTESIFNKKSEMNNYSLAEFLGSSSNQFPMPSSMKKALLQYDFRHKFEEPDLTTQMTEDLPFYHASTSKSMGSSFKTAVFPTSTSTQVMQFERLIPKVTMPKLLSNDSTFAILGAADGGTSIVSLQLAINTFELIYTSAKKMSLHRGLAAILILQCDEVLVTIRDNADKADRPKLHAAIDKTIETFTAIRLDMAIWSSYNTWRCWWERHTIEDKLHEYRILVEHSLDILGLSANFADDLDGVGNIKKGKAAEKGDQQEFSDIRHEVQEIQALVSRLHNTRKSISPGSTKYEDGTNTLRELTIKPKHNVLRPPNVESESLQIVEHPLFSNPIQRGSSYSDIRATHPTASTMRQHGDLLFPNRFGPSDPPYSGRAPSRNCRPSEFTDSSLPRVLLPESGYPPRMPSPSSIPRTPQLSMPTHYEGPAPSSGYQMTFPATPDPSPFASDASFPRGRSEHVGSLSIPYSPDYGSSQSSMNPAQPHRRFPTNPSPPTTYEYNYHKGVDSQPPSGSPPFRESPEDAYSPGFPGHSPPSILVHSNQYSPPHSTYFPPTPDFQSIGTRSQPDHFRPFSGPHSRQTTLPTEHPNNRIPSPSRQSTAPHSHYRFTDSFTSRSTYQPWTPFTPPFSPPSNQLFLQASPPYNEYMNVIRDTQVEQSDDNSWLNIFRRPVRLDGDMPVMGPPAAWTLPDFEEQPLIPGPRVEMPPIQPIAFDIPLTMPGSNKQMEYQYSQCTGMKKGLFIGINYLRTPKAALQGCINDANDMKNFVIRKFGYKEEDIVILTDDTRDSRKYPSKANIIRALLWLVRDASANDSLFFHCKSSKD